MRHLSLNALALALPLSPADARAGAATAPAAVAEIVTFRLLPGTDETAFLEAARATGPAVAAQPGFLRRSLSRDETGLWTDHVEWADLPSALAAAEAVITMPDFAPFAALIDPEGLTMRHAPVIWQMGD
jgi:hypothetical protein